MSDGEQSLDTRIIRSSAWAVLSYGGSTVLSLLATLVLARLLTPDDFGVIALTVSLLSVVQLAQDSGVGAALVVYRGDIRRAAGSALVFSPVASVGLYAVCFVAAPLLADIFDSPDLTDVFRVTALVVPIRGMAIVPTALLQREMAFGPLTVMELGGGIAQAVTAIGLGLAGAGVWSLAFGQIAFAIVPAVLAWVFAPFKPSLRLADRGTLRELMRFGRHVGAANMINYGNGVAAPIVIGRVLGTNALGYFSLANRLAAMPVQIIGNILGRGVYAALARLQDDAAGFRRVWLENIQRVALVSIPATIGLIVVAEPMVEVLFGPKWEPIVIPLQILALNGIVKTFAATAGEVFQAQQRPHLRVVIEGAHLALVLPAIVAGAEIYGLNGVAAAIVIVNAVTGLPAIWLVARSVGVGPRGFAVALARPALGWVVFTAALAVLVPVADRLSPGLELVTLVTAGVAVYVATVVLFSREIALTMWRSLRGAPRESPAA